MKKDVYATRRWKGSYKEPEKYDITSIWFGQTGIELKTLMEIVSFRNRSVLDVGAGRGRLTFPISKIAKNVCAVEPNKELFEYMKNKIEKTSLENIEVKKASAEDIPYQDNSFDIVLCSWVMSHLKDPEKSFYEMKRVLKVNGILIIIEHGGNDDYEKLSTIENPKYKGIREERIDFILKHLKDTRKIKTIIESCIEFPDLETARKVIGKLIGCKASRYVKENEMLKTLDKILIVCAKK